MAAAYFTAGMGGAIVAIMATPQPLALRHPQAALTLPSSSWPRMVALVWNGVSPLPWIGGRKWFGCPSLIARQVLFEFFRLVLKIPGKASVNFYSFARHIGSMPTLGLKALRVKRSAPINA
ncbi:hypothetical protein D9M71_497630 [compost metagenome]